MLDMSPSKGKLTLGKMNCSTGLYQTPLAMVPGAGALNRAVTTGSCTQKQAVRESKVTGDQNRAPYLLVQLEELHRHVALKLRPRPTGKHPQPGDDHRVEHLKVQRNGCHIRGRQLRGAGHLHKLDLLVLTCHWSRAGGDWGLL